MSEYLTGAEMKELLVEAITTQLRNARLDFDDAPHDQGDPETGRLSTRDTIRESARLLREMRAVPVDDSRIVRLTELVPTVDMLLGALPDDGGLPVGSIDLFLDSLVSHAVKAAGT
jgi:hypothetical protein